MTVRLAVASRFLSGVTGTTTTVIEHVRRLKARGWEVYAYAEKLDPERLEAAGARCRRVARLPIGSYIKRRFFAWASERCIRRDGPFDLVWGHGDSLAQDVLSLHNCVHAAHEAVRGSPLPVTAGVGIIHRRILAERRFRLLIANSQLMKEEVSRRFGVPEESVAVVHPGHDPERFRPEDKARLRPGLRAELGVRDGEVLAGLVTSGDLRKRGADIFLMALAGLPPERKARLRVLVVGAESRLGPYRELASQTGLGERIRFLPPMPDVERCYHALDLYVHPALYEEFGQSVQEAMACRVPVLTSVRVGAAELLRGEARGMLLDKPDPEGLAYRMGRLIEEPGVRERWAQMGREAVRRNTWEENFLRTYAFLARLR